MPDRVLVLMILEHEGATLLGRRKVDKPPFAGRWFLPGDEMRADESAEETINRFVREELDVKVVTGDFVTTLTLDDGGIVFMANVFRVTPFTGAPRYRESGPYSEVRYLFPEDLSNADIYPMPPGLRDLLTGASERSES